MAAVQLVGRSSSHFTRVARIFALELGVAHDFRPVLDLTTLETSAYADNPALKIPILVDEQGSLFGAENICRAFLQRSGKAASVVMRGDVPDRAVANAEELTLHVMSSGVSLLMAKATGGANAVPAKVTSSLQNSLRYLDEALETTLALLPEGRLFSFLEVTLFCVTRHLEFREIADVSPFRSLNDFCQRFAERDSAQATPYRFDSA
jgi:glutathione S-transferase